MLLGRSQKRSRIRTGAVKRQKQKDKQEFKFTFDVASTGPLTEPSDTFNRDRTLREGVFRCLITIHLWVQYVTH